MSKELQNLQDQIIELVRPLKIILFGSRAKGNFHNSSDYDILVVMPNGTNKRQTAHSLYRQIEDVNISYDFIVVTEDTLQKYSNAHHLVYFHALKDGIELYAA